VTTSALTIRSAVLEEIARHARAALPLECCGLLLGASAAVVESVRTRNAATDPNRFVIHPTDHINGRRDARTRGLDVVGFYHSHPRSAADPSVTDRAEASYPDHLYLIVGIASDPPEWRLFRFSGIDFVALSFVAGQ
jgi:proteasome lid subunit RPN8/RPN11